MNRYQAKPIVRRIGWVFLTLLAVALWMGVGAMMAADLMNESTYTYKMEVAAYEY